jgi:hypothetical protein
MNLARLTLFFLLLVGLPAFAGGKTAPAKPEVTDDGAYTASSTQLHAKWTASNPESAIVKFRYQIREGSTSGPIIVGWKSAGLATEITHAGLSLHNGKSYYIGVKAINSQGKASEVGYSDGITVAVNPVLEVGHSPLDFSSTIGGLKSITIKSSGSRLPWTATSNVPWLSLSSTSGTTPSTIVVSANSPGLPRGRHSGIISISAQTAQNSPVSISANLVVADDGTAGNMKPVTIKGKRFYSDGKPYFPSTHFLMMNPNSSHVYFSDFLSDADREEIVNDIKSGGYNSIFLYTLNQGDYDGKSVSPYQRGIIGGAFDDAKIQIWRDDLVNLIHQGIRPILWLVADESGVIRSASTIELKRYIQKMVHSFDDLPIMWVLGLEVDEYWSKAQADDLGIYLRSIAENPVGIHQLRGQTSMMTSDWVEFAVYQEGFKGDWTTIYSSALEKQTAIGTKPLLFAEYEHGIIMPSFQKGLAAAFAGSAGVGNGAPGTLDEFMASLPDNMVPSRSGNHLYLTGSGIHAIADLTNLTFFIQHGPP